MYFKKELSKYLAVYQVIKAFKNDGKLFMNIY